MRPAPILLGARFRNYVVPPSGTPLSGGRGTRLRGGEGPVAIYIHVAEFNSSWSILHILWVETSVEMYGPQKHNVLND